MIILTAKADLSDRVKGLQMGAEDYIVKPFEVLELLARVQVVLWRYNKTERVLQAAGISVDTASMQVLKEGKPIALTSKEP